jgi:hypothetical protein
MSDSIETEFALAADVLILLRVHVHIVVTLFGDPSRRIVVVMIGQTLAEAFDALGDIAHDIGNLSAAAEHKNGDEGQNQNMPDTQRTHCNAPSARPFVANPC